VGDLLRTDIAGAQNVGMQAVQYIGVNHDTGAIPSVTPETRIIPDGVLKNLTELIPFLRQLRGD
jgi:FMN phosphatase YigB (HAD superfamily)